MNNAKCFTFVTRVQIGSELPTHIGCATGGRFAVQIGRGTGQRLIDGVQDCGRNGMVGNPERDGVGHDGAGAPARAARHDHRDRAGPGDFSQCEDAVFKRRGDFGEVVSPTGWREEDGQILAAGSPFEAKDPGNRQIVGGDGAERVLRVGGERDDSAISQMRNC